MASATAQNIDTGKDYKVEKNPEVPVQRVIAIEKVERSDGGSYKITAKNENGEDVKLLNVKVIDLPTVPQDLAVIKMTNDSCGFVWTEPDDNGGDSIKRYSIEYRIGGDDWQQKFTKGDEKEYTLKKLPQGKFYIFYLKIEK